MNETQVRMLVFAIFCAFVAGILIADLWDRLHK